MKTIWHSMLPLLLSLLTLILMPISNLNAFGSISIKATLDTAEHTISGSMLVRFETNNIIQDSVILRLYPNKFCDEAEESRCGIMVDSVLEDGNLCQSFLDDDKMHLAIKRTEHSKQPFDHLTVFFTTAIPELQERFGYRESVYSLETWFPMPAPFRNGEWQTPIYDQNAEPVADFFDISMQVQTPAGWTVAAAGVVNVTNSDSLTTTTLRLNPTHDYGIALVQDMLLRESQCGDITLKMYYPEEAAHLIDTTIDIACRTLEYMNESLTPYPYNDLVILFGAYPAGGALELPGMIWFPETSSQLFMRWLQMSVIHETVHQWFYGLFASNQAEEPWLDESITEYFTVKLNNLWCVEDADFISAYGLESNLEAIHRMTSRRIWQERRIDLPSYTYGKSSYLRAIYGKGSLTILTLFRIMGEVNEKEFWRRWSDKFSFSYPDRADFIAELSKLMPLTDSSIVSEMLSSTTLTDFSVESLKSRLIANSTVVQDEHDSSAYRTTVDLRALYPIGYPVDLRVEFVDGSFRDSSLILLHGRTEILFVSNSPANAAIVDRNYKYAVDQNLLNNSLQLSSGAGNGLRLFSGLHFMIESLLSSLWGF